MRERWREAWAELVVACCRVSMHPQQPQLTAPVAGPAMAHCCKQGCERRFRRMCSWHACAYSRFITFLRINCRRNRAAESVSHTNQVY